jgi:nucleoside-diphosphate-sugar epimerase
MDTSELVAVVGGSGYIGRHLMGELKTKKNCRIKSLTRSSSRTIEAVPCSMVEEFQGDMLNPDSLHGFFEPGCTVINLMYLWTAGEAENLKATQNLLNACAVAKVKRVIHCSTAAVVGRTYHDWVTELTPCNPITSYGVVKLKVEQAIINAGKGHFDVAILRPTSVFGPDGDPLKKLANNLVLGNPLINYLKSCLFGSRRMNLVPIANVVSAIEFLMHQECKLDGEIFIVADDDSSANNFNDVENCLMRSFDVNRYWLPRIHLPLVFLEILLRVMGRNSSNPRCNYASTKLRDWGFVRTVTFKDALAEYASWYRSSHLI